MMLDLLSALRKKLGAMKRHVKAWTGRVMRRAAAEPGYIQAVASLSAVCIELFCGRVFTRLAYRAAHTVVVLLDILRSLHEEPAWP